MNSKLGHYMDRIIPIELDAPQMST